MATAKARTVNPREGVGYQIDSASDGNADETLSYSLVNFRNPDPHLSTHGFAVGDRCDNGPYTGAVVKALYGIPLGCIIELEHGGRVVTLLNTGEYSGVLK